MLSLTDARTPLAAPGSRRVSVAYDASSLRCAVLADTVRRIGELRRLTVAVHRVPRDGVPSPDGYAYNVHPPLPEQAPDGVDVAVGVDLPDARAVLGVADAEPWPDADPLVFRLAVLASERTSGLEAAPREAAAELDELRRAVAQFAEAPSAPLPADPVAAVLAALEDDLATPRALAAVRELAQDTAVAPGARFEGLVFLDRYLGLDLAADIGRQT